MTRVKITERGWAGHYCCAHRCRFRRNTLIECKNNKIVVSTVGCMDSINEKGFDEIGAGRHYETMAFHAKKKDTRYHDADVTKIVKFDSDWRIAKLDADDKANIMHDKVVKEICGRLK